MTKPWLVRAVLGVAALLLTACGAEFSGPSSDAEASSTSSPSSSSSAKPNQTPAPNADLTDPSFKELAFQLVSTAENSTVEWWKNFGYIDDIGDTRGYTGGLVGFTSGTGDMYELVLYYDEINPVTLDDVKRVRAEAATRKTPWTVAELAATLPKQLPPDESWKITASHNATAARNALSMTTWNSQAPQAPGMWFQIELPQPAMVTEIQFDSPAGGRGGGGGGGRGAAAAPAGRGGAAGGAPAAAAGGATTPAAAAATPPTEAAALAAAQGGGRGGPGGAAQAPPNPAYPREFKVDVSLNGTTWTPVATGKGVGASTIITFPPAQAKFVRITQTGTVEGAPNWSIQQLRIFSR